MAENNLISNLSYTNKDFNSIYVELLDLVKKLSYKWDPTISNESDPGVLLLKLMAICADKNNYTADKTILECFPESVTQEQNARKLFEQLGYTMHWYRAGSTNLSIRWVGEKTDYYYNIPRFTMVSDDEGSVVYTIMDEFSISGDGKANTSTIRALQGIAEDYTVNGNTLITSANLDYQNRLYFPDRNVAENGIRICNADSTSNTGRQDNYDSWSYRENLEVEKLGQYIYKFGVSSDGTQCYIEFPEDIESLMGEGLYITYVKTDGEDGNIASRVLERFYNDVIISDPADESKTITLNSDNVVVTNLSSVRDGYNPESINSAFRNYKKTVGTFNTLVALRDYANAINESGLVSNSFVCDRTDDLQSTYNIVSRDGNIDRKIHKVMVDQVSGSPELTAFDLKLYMLQAVTKPSTVDEYNRTFSVIKNVGSNEESIVQEIEGYIDEQKSVQHDFMRLIPERPVMFKNKYVVDCKIIPQYKVTTLQENEIKESIRKALYSNLNSSEIDFGDGVKYSDIYDIIVNSDERIKAITMENISYTTYAVYYSSETDEYREVEVNKLEQQSVGYYDTTTSAFYSNATYVEGTGWTFSNKITPVPNGIYYDKITNKCYRCTGISGSTYTFKYDIKSNMQDDIYAKSVLNGNTTLFVKSGKFDFGLNQSYSDTVDYIARMTTNVNIELSGETSATYLIRKNESIQLSAPNLLDKEQYSSNVRYEYILSNDVPSGSDYAMSGSDGLVVYWKDSNDDESDYNYVKYGAGTIIKPSFTMKSSGSSSNYTGNALPLIPTGEKSVRGTTYGVPFGDGTLTEYIKSEMSGSKNVLSATKSITIRDVNISNIKNNVYRCCWYLNTKDADGKFELFPATPASTQTKVLQYGEYFMYTNNEGSELYILGSGTKITRTSESAMPKLVCDVSNISSVQNDGADALDGYWVTIPDGQSLTVQEMQFISLGEGTTFKVVPVTSGAFSFKFTNRGIIWTKGTSLSQFMLSYMKHGENKYTDIPGVVLTGGDGWDGRSVLNIACSPSMPQKLLGEQSFTYSTFDVDTGEIVYDVDTITGSDASPAYILSDYPYDMDGGVNVDVSRQNSNGEYSYMSIYSYDATTSSDSRIKYNSDGTIDIDLGQSPDNVKELEFNIPAGNYIIPLSHSNTSLTSLTVKLSVDGGSTYTSVYPIYGGSGEYKNSGIYYLLMTIPQSTVQCFLKVTSAGSDTSYPISIGKLLKFEKPESMSDGTFEAVLQRVFYLDTDNKYDYTYEVPDDNLIEDPLSSESFLNKNHIFNKFTICQIDTKNMSIYMTNKIK